MKRVLITGMSGTGKSSVLGQLGALGYPVIDTDEGGYTVEVRSETGVERLWREDRIQHVLSSSKAEVLFIAGTCRNQVQFYRQFDHIVLLSAPAEVLVERLATRAGNPYGKRPEELAETLRLLATVEPLLRAAATLEVDTRVALDQVVMHILHHIGAETLTSRLGGELSISEDAIEASGLSDGEADEHRSAAHQADIDRLCAQRGTSPINVSDG